MEQTSDNGEDPAIIVLARYAGELEAQVAQLTADLAAAHHALAARDAVIRELRKRLPALEAAAGYERVVGVPV